MYGLGSRAQGMSRQKWIERGGIDSRVVGLIAGLGQTWGKGAWQYAHSQMQGNKKAAGRVPIHDVVQ